STLSECYDYFHLVILGSLVVAVSLIAPTLASALAPATLVALLAAYLLGALSVGPIWVALYGLSDTISQRELPGMGAMLGALRKFYWRGVGLFLVYAFILGGTLLAAWFYQWKFEHWLLEGISLLWVYFSIFWVMMNLYVPAFLVMDDESIWSALRKGFILTMAHPGYTFLVFVQVGCVVAMIAAPILGRVNWAMGLSFILFFMFLPGFVSLLSTNAMRDLLRKHEEAEAEDEE
ncbi:MAG TPA: hypothetical protein QGH10_00590, partial [Armatimonadota bacterium]|nr:hypothetical protein [Armatimonadota bacterium]